MQPGKAVRTRVRFPPPPPIFTTVGLLALGWMLLGCALVMAPDVVVLRGGWYEVGVGTGVLRAYFDPGSCFGSCNAELEEFLKDVRATAGTHRLALVLAGEIPLDLDGGVEIDDPELHGLTVDCSAGPVLSIGDSTPSTYRRGAIAGPAGATEVSGVDTAWCGADARCGSDDDEIKSGDLLWDDDDPDEVYLVAFASGATSLRLSRRLTAPVSGAYTVSRGAILRVERPYVQFVPEAGCHVRCEDACAHDMGQGARSIPVSVITGSRGADLRGFDVLLFDHKHDFAQVSACYDTDSRWCTGGAAVLGGAVVPTFTPREARYLRTGEDSGDVDNPANNGDGAAFATVAGGTRIEIRQGAVGYCARQVLIGEYNSSTEIHGSGEDSPWIEAPVGCSGCLAVSQSQEQAYDCADLPGGCEPDLEPWIDIGDARVPGKPWTRFVNNWHLTVPFWFSDPSAVFLRISDPTARVGLFATLDARPTTRLIDVPTSEGPGPWVYGVVHATAPGLVLDPDVRFHGTFCSGAQCR